MKSQFHLGFILLDYRIIIDYVVNPTYILSASKPRQIQVNCLLNLMYAFKYPTRVNNIKNDDMLIYTFDTQAVNQLSPYACRVQITPSSGPRVEPLLLHIHIFIYIYCTQSWKSKPEFESRIFEYGTEG